MESRTPIIKEQIIGKLIAFVHHVDLPYDAKERFQQRLIVIELQSGLRFALQQGEDVFHKDSRLGIIYPHTDILGLQAVLTFETDPNLRSPIRSLFIPFRWKDSPGVALENGFVLHDGFSERDNAVSFYKPGLQTIPNLVEFDLPNETA